MSVHRPKPDPGPGPVPDFDPKPDPDLGPGPGLVPDTDPGPIPSRFLSELTWFCSVQVNPCLGLSSQSWFWS